MWEQTMALTRTRLGRTRSQVRSPPRPPAPPSPISSTSTDIPLQPSPSSAVESGPSIASDTAMVRNMKKLISDFEELHRVKDAPLADPRVTSIRKEIEKAMPRLYAMTSDEKYIPQDAKTVKGFAEDLLRKCDVNVDALRSSVASERRLPSNLSLTHAAASTLSPGPSLPQAPASAPVQGSARMPFYAKSEGSSPCYFPEPPPHLKDVVETMTLEQKKLLIAVKEISATTAGRMHDASEAWYNPPPGQSPKEVESARQDNPMSTSGYTNRIPYRHPSPSPPPLPQHPGQLLFPLAQPRSLYPPTSSFEIPPHAYMHTQRSALHDSTP